MRRRLADFLGGRERGFLLRLVRDAAFAAAVAASLLGPGAGAGAAQAVELRDVAEGRGGFVIRGSWSHSGWSVSGAGDVNGDGVPDLLVGDAGWEVAGAYVVFGKGSGEAVELTDIAAGTGGFVIQAYAACYGHDLSVSGAGDVNGDGLADLLIGAPFLADFGTGDSYVVFGNPGGEAVALADIVAGTGGFVVRGIEPWSVCDADMVRVSGAGDVNGDGDTGGVTDAVFLLSYNFTGGRKPPCLAACDASGDGRAEGEVTDAVYLLTYNFLGGPPPPAPFPDCGAEAEADAVLGCETLPEDCP